MRVIYTLVHLIERRTGPDGRVLHFVTRTGRRPWLKVFPISEVPPFEGDKAWFEVEHAPGRPWRFLRQVERQD